MKKSRFTETQIVGILKEAEGGLPMEDLRGLRDKALLLLAYDSLCRRSELASIRLDDVECDDGMSPVYIRLRRSKTDQEAFGIIVRPTTRTLACIKDWIDSSRIRGGHLFRGIKNNSEIMEGINPGQINRIYKRLAENAGLPKKKIKRISGHSIRIGAAQDLAESGSSLPKIMVKGRWSKVETVMRYIERANGNI
jgi:integrase